MPTKHNHILYILGVVGTPVNVTFWINAKRHNDGLFYYSTDNKLKVNVGEGNSLSEQQAVNDSTNFDCLVFSATEIDKFVFQSVNCNEEKEVLCYIKNTFSGTAGINLYRFPCMKEKKSEISSNFSQCQPSESVPCGQYSPG